MRRLALAVVSIVLVMLAGSVRGATPEEVDGAIKKAVEYLYSQQQGANWETVQARDPKKGANDVDGGQWGGQTGLVTCALLYAGESRQKRELKQAIDWLMQAEVVGTYSLGFRCQVWTMVAPSEAVKRVAVRDARWLMEANIKEGPARGCFPYYFENGKARPNSDEVDHSVSQYGMLGLWACSQLNLEIPTGFWVEMERMWKSHQYEDGGWSYRYKHEDANASKSTISMTAAGVASLFITQETVHAMEGLTVSGYFPDESLDRGLKWIGEHFPEFEHHQTYYSLYGVERIGVASGYKYFGKLNWYEHGAEFLVSRQNEDGSFGDGLVDTSFALMFMSRGRAPVLMNKLQYTLPQVGTKPKGPAWCQRPRDAANIARWLGKQLEHDLNWQIVNLQAPVDELHDAPILWIAGKELLAFTAEEEGKLRTFVEQGGLIVGNADMGSKAFSDSFKALGHKLFRSYEFRELPAGHAIYTSEQYPRSEWQRPPSLLGLSNGVRELMLLFPQSDPSKGWQMQSFSGGDRGPVSQLMADIFQYAVDKKGMRHKGQTYLIQADAKKKASQTVKVARVQHAGNWDPEPAGWRRLANAMHNDFAVDLVVEPVKLGSGKLASTYKVAHLTGTLPLALTAGEQAELRKWVEGGGVLIVEAAGGKVEFAGTAEKVLAEAFKPAALKVLGMEHPVYNVGQKIAQLEWRHFVRKMPGKSARLSLRGMEVGGKVRVFFSPADLSVGLVGQAVDGIDGYERGGALSLMQNMILYAGK